MNGKTPKVSVIIPTFNSQSSICQTVKSVVNQSYKNWELIFVDDGSTDDTVSILRKIKKNYSNKVKVYLKPSNTGVTSSRNIGIQIATGKYIAFLDSDDIWHPEKLSIQIDEMEKRKIEFGYTNYYAWNLNKDKLYKVLSPSDVNYQSLRKGNTIGCLTVIYNQDRIGKVSIPDLEKRNDFALWLEILSKKPRTGLIDDFLAIKIDYAQSLSSGSKVMLMKYHYLLFRNNRNYGVISSIWFSLLNVISYLKKRLMCTMDVTLEDKNYILEQYELEGL